MLKLLGKLRKRERLLAAVCLIIVLGQCWLDLTLADSMKDLTVLIQTSGSTPKQVWLIGRKMLGCALGSVLLALLCGRCAAQVAAGFSYSLRETVFGKVAELGKAEMDRFSVPNLIIRTTDDVAQIQLLLSSGLQVLVRAPIMVAWAVVKITGKSRALSGVARLVAVVLGVVLLIMVLVLTHRCWQGQKNPASHCIPENPAGGSASRSFIIETFADVIPLLQMTANGLWMAVYWLGATLIQAIPAADMGTRIGSFGDMITISVYAAQVMLSLMMSSMLFPLFPAAQMSASRIWEVLDSIPSERVGKQAKGEGKGTVEFRNVSFTYPNGEGNVLENISFRVKRGQTVAVVGDEGCGKSTLVRLVARLYDATEGQILVDGVDVRKYSFDTLCDKIGYAPQKAILFSGSVRSNVRFGESTAPSQDEDLWEAIGLAQATEFVELLPDGLHSRVEQGGRNLSEGQKQQLSIARALARKPEILIFDDCFWALDDKVERALRAGLKEQRQGTTVLLVTQHIGTIWDADRILVLEHGRLVGQGSHEELLKTCPVYQKIAVPQRSYEEAEGR